MKQLQKLRTGKSRAQQPRRATERSKQSSQACCRDPSGPPFSPSSGLGQKVAIPVHAPEKRTAEKLVNKPEPKRENPLLAMLRKVEPRVGKRNKTAAITARQAIPALQVMAWLAVGLFVGCNSRTDE